MADAALKTPGYSGMITAIKSDPLVLAMFLSLLLIGGDLLSITAGGLTLRLVFPVLMIAFAFLFQRIGVRITFNAPLAFLFFLLTVAAAVSIRGTLDPVKSIGYTVWVLFDFFIIISLGYNFARLYPPDLTLRLWLLVYRIHAGLLIVELLGNIVLHHSLGRPHLWFYELSYLAIFMSGYFGSALFLLLREGKAYRLDFGIALVGMIATTSATGLFAMIFAVLLNFAVARQRVLLMVVTLSLLAVFLGTLYMFFRGTVYYDLMAGFLISGQGLSGAVDLILGRAGDRWIRALVGWDAFLRHPWTGVGIGGDSAYMGATPYPDTARAFLQPWMETDQGQPFSNILIEVAGTMGALGLAPVFAILGYAGYSSRKSLRQRETQIGAAFFMGFFAIFLALQFESTFLRYYLWMPLGLGFGILAQAKNPVAAAPDVAPLAGQALA